MNAFENELTRYFKADHLARIKAKRIAIAGAGGLGSNIAVALVRTGFRNIEILDKDTVEPSNLNRQDYTLHDVGRLKVDALKTRLLTINPEANILIHPVEWSLMNADGLFNNASIVVEAFDTTTVKATFVEYYARHAPFVVSGNGMAGLNPTTSATALRQVGNIFIVGDGATSTDDGQVPLAPRVVQCAAKMAEVVLSLTLT